MSKESRRIMEETYGSGAGGGGSRFLDRLENDMRKRDTTRKTLQSKYYSTEALFQDPMRARRLYEHDLEFVRDYIATKGLLNEVRDRGGDRGGRQVVHSVVCLWRLAAVY